MSVYGHIWSIWKTCQTRCWRRYTKCRKDYPGVRSCRNRYQRCKNWCLRIYRHFDEVGDEDEVEIEDEVENENQDQDQTLEISDESVTEEKDMQSLEDSSSMSFVFFILHQISTKYS